MKIELKVNGKPTVLEAEPHEFLTEVLLAVLPKNTGHSPGTPVVGRKGHPGSVRLNDCVGDAFGLPREVLGATENTVFRIKPVIQTEVGSSIQCQHHDSADAGW